MPLECSICLSAFKDPVCIPCGHIYCKKCLTDHVNLPTNDDLNSSCPICRAQFTTVMPDLTYLPKKYHQYVIPSVRQVYIDTSGERTLKKKITQAEERIRALEREKAQLLIEGNRDKATLQIHAAREREATSQARIAGERLNRLTRLRNEDSEVATRDINEAYRERDHIQAQYDDLQQQFDELAQKFKAQATKNENRDKRSRSSVPNSLPAAEPTAGSPRSASETLINWDIGSMTYSLVSTQIPLEPLSPSFDPPHTQSARVARKIRPLPRLRRTREDPPAEQSLSLPPHFDKRPRYSEPGPSTQRLSQSMSSRPRS
ncbi:hypothetical protein BDN72DRAFT_877163 [Pluteus cervinus]|uniref:Uncharacterized protein n=1 Tax=Pluteus cervinus TaxID=181527 RepID=A0ACD3B022_9AGAR|nr:hypothetical protein BDN72DRAFT_877163 [Pluteus cervinus]